MSAFDVKRAAELIACPAEHRWLVDGLWADQAVGIVGGEPKCCKSFLALDLAVSVASGAACLRRFHPSRKGPVLLYAAEDALHIVRQRLHGICAVANVSFDRLDVHAITAPSVRIDLDADRRRLSDTVAAIKPVLVVLDPFVRLHRIDENASSEVAPLLAFLRDLQRRFHTAVLLVHHARKGAASARAGQALRGSSELHAWGDSNLYLRRHRDQLWLATEQRAAPSVPAIPVALAGNDGAVALHILDAPTSVDLTPTPSVTDRLIEALSAAEQPLTRRALRDACKMKSASVGQALHALIELGTVIETASGYHLAPR